MANAIVPLPGPPILGKVVHTLKLVFSEAQIQEAVRRLAREVEADYHNTPLLVVGVLRGSFVFLADLVRQLHVPLTVDFVRLSSYGASTTSSGRVWLHHGLRSPIRGWDILVVEDIVDTGLTTSFLLSYLKGRGATSVRVCALLDKPSRRQVPVPIDYVGFHAPDRFLVGYGLDFNQRYRELPAVYALEEETHESETPDRRGTGG